MTACLPAAAAMQTPLHPCAASWRHVPPQQIVLHTNAPCRPCFKELFNSWHMPPAPSPTVGGRRFSAQLSLRAAQAAAVGRPLMRHPTCIAPCPAHLQAIARTLIPATLSPACAVARDCVPARQPTGACTLPPPPQPSPLPPAPAAV